MWTQDESNARRDTTWRGSMFFDGLRYCSIHKFIMVSSIQAILDGIEHMGGIVSSTVLYSNIFLTFLNEKQRQYLTFHCHSSCEHCSLYIPGQCLHVNCFHALLLPGAIAVECKRHGHLVHYNMMVKINVVNFLLQATHEIQLLF